VNTSTIKFEVAADTYSDILDAAEDELCAFLAIDLEELKKVQYELLIERDDNVKAEFTYRATVVAKVKK
jgi:hypothetical protein